MLSLLREFNTWKAFFMLKRVWWISSQMYVVVSTLNWLCSSCGRTVTDSTKCKHWQILGPNSEKWSLSVAYPQVYCSRIKEELYMLETTAGPSVDRELCHILRYVLWWLISSFVYMICWNILRGGHGNLTKSYVMYILWKPWYMGHQ